MDRREKKTKRAIREAFLALLKLKKIHQITVTKISQTADLGRGTFYLHYKDVYDLYDQIENELYSDLEQILARSFPDANPLQNFTNTLTEYIDVNRELFLLFITPENCGKTLYKIKTIFNGKAFWDSPESQPSKLSKAKSVFCVSGIIGVLEEWLYNGLQTPREEVANMLHRFLLQFYKDDDW